MKQGRVRAGQLRGSVRSSRRRIAALSSSLYSSWTSPSPLLMRDVPSISRPTCPPSLPRVQHRHASTAKGHAHSRQFASTASSWSSQMGAGSKWPSPPTHASASASSHADADAETVSRKRTVALEGAVREAAAAARSAGRPIRVVVLGGGVSGLVCARSLRDACLKQGGKISASSGKQTDVVIDVIEASDRVGGWLHSEKVPSRSDASAGHYIFEKGARGMRPRGSGRRALRLIESLGLQEDALVTQGDGEARWVLHEGRPMKLPTSPMGLIQGLPMVPNTLGTFGLEFTRAAHPSGLSRGGHGTPDESVHAFFTRRFGGPALADSLLDAIVAGVWAGDVKALSAQSLFPLPTAWEDAVGSIQAGALASMIQSIGVPLPAAIKARLDRGGGAKKAVALGAALEAQDIKEGPSSVFVREASKASSVSFKGGMGQLADALAQDLGLGTGAGDNASGDVQVQTSVKSGTQAIRIDRASKGNGTSPYVVVVASPSVPSGETRIQADIVISALPSDALAKVLRASSTSDTGAMHSWGEGPSAWEALDAIPYESVVSVSVGLRGEAAQVALPADRRGFGYLCPSREEKSVLGCVWDSCAFPGQKAANEAGSSDETIPEARLSVMMGGARDRGLIDASDDDVVGTAMDALVRHMDVNLGKKGEGADAVMVSRARHAIPQYIVGHGGRLQAVDAAFSSEQAPSLVRGLALLGNWRGGVGVADAVAQGEEIGVQLGRCLARQ